MGACRTAQNNHSNELVLTGPVLDVGHVPITNQCFFSSLPAEAFEFQIADAKGEVWNFQVYIPGFQNPLAKDDVISVTSSFSDSPWFGHESDLEVRDENGALLFYVGEGGDTATLNPPEGYAVSFGEALCSGESSCGSWIHSELVVTSGDESVAVPYLGSSTLGGRRVVHGGAETQTSSGFHGCFDWGVGRAALAIHPLD